MKIINSLDRRVLANQCLPVFHHPPLLCYHFNHLPLSEQYWYKVDDGIVQLRTSHNQYLILEWHSAPPTITVLILNSMCLLYIHMYIYICFNWAICHHQIYFKFPWQLSTSCTSSHWKHLSGWNECPTKMFLLRITKLGFYCILFFCSLRPALVVASSGRPSLRRDCWASVTSRWSSWMEEQRCVILQCSHWIMHSVCPYSTISQCVLVEGGMFNS